MSPVHFMTECQETLCFTFMVVLWTLYLFCLKSVTEKDVAH
jgi:hypothetical protein